MQPLRAVVFLLLTGYSAARICKNVTFSVDTVTRQGLFPEIPAQGNLEVTAFAQELTQAGRNYTATILQGYRTLRRQFEISAKYCQPDGGPGSTIQLLTHGIGFDKSYWDLPYNNYNYSYVEVATAKGYSTLAIDRPGIGGSSHGDPINLIQAQIEVEALNGVTYLLRRGQISGINNIFNKVIHVGHSFGSIQSYWLSALYPNNTDGLVLTGWSANGNSLPQTIAGWDLHSARLNQPYRFGNASVGVLQKTIKDWLGGSSFFQAVQKFLPLESPALWNEIATTEVLDLINGYNQTGIRQYNYASGYLTHSDLTANQYVFLRYGRYDIGLGVFSEKTKQPVTIGELLTLGSAPAKSYFSGPVLVYTGEYDQPFCGLNCYDTGGAAASIPAQSQALFPKARTFEAYIQPDTGHGINVHYNSTAGNKYVQDWLGAHGLAA